MFLFVKLKKGYGYARRSYTLDKNSAFRFNNKNITSILSISHGVTYHENLTHILSVDTRFFGRLYEYMY